MKTQIYYLHRCPACHSFLHNHVKWDDTLICRTPICVWHKRYIVDLRTGLGWVYATFQEAQQFMGVAT